jgi:hypothetical protein
MENTDVIVSLQEQTLWILHTNDGVYAMALTINGDKF